MTTFISQDRAYHLWFRGQKKTPSVARTKKQQREYCKRCRMLRGQDPLYEILLPGTRPLHLMAGSPSQQCFLWLLHSGLLRSPQPCLQKQGVRDTSRKYPEKFWLKFCFLPCFYECSISNPRFLRIMLKLLGQY